MRQLEVVAVSDDGGYVLLAGSEDAARPTHQLRIDDRLTAAVRGDLDDSEPRESELSPKEIQSRLRAGESVEDVAKVARVALSRVQRYAGPVISERDRVVEQAQASRLRRHRGIEAMTTLGELVEQRLPATTGFRWDSAVWDARRRDDGNWIVSLTYHARGSRTAQWLWQPASRELVSLNALGTRLGTDDPPGTPRRRAPARRAPAKRAPAKRSLAKRSTAKRSAPKRSAPKAAMARRTAAPTAKRAAPKKATPKKATPRQAAPKKAAPKRAPATTRKPAAPTRAAPTRAARRTATPKPAVPRTRRTPAPAVEPAKKRPSGRVPIPTWDDVLLGVQRPAARGRRRS